MRISVPTHRTRPLLSPPVTQHADSRLTGGGRLSAGLIGSSWKDPALAWMFLVPLALWRIGTGLHHLMVYKDLREHGVQVRAQVVGTAPGVAHSRAVAGWVINPLVSWTKPDGRTVQQGIGAKNRPIRVAAGAEVTLFHAPHDTRQLMVDDRGTRVRIYADFVFGGIAVALALALLLS